MLSKKRVRYRSKLEEKFALDLQKSGVEYKYEAETLKYILSRSYKPDFVIYRPEKDPLYLEVKGYLRPADRTKMAAVRRAHPEVDIRFVFAKNQLIAGSKMMYSDWCKKHNYPCAFGYIPVKWLT